MKKNKILIGLVLSASICFAVGVSTFNVDKNSDFVGTYNVTAFAGESGLEEELYATKRNVSVAGDYMLLATAFNVDPTEYEEVGYEVTVDNGTPIKYGSADYYTGITIKTGETTTMDIGATDIYGQEIEHMGLIVCEITYDAESSYLIRAYMTPNGGEAQFGETVTVDSSVAPEDTAVSVAINGEYTVGAGDNFDNLDVSVVGTFADGDRTLDASEYTLNVPNEKAVLGKAYQIEVVYNANKDVKAVKDVSVIAKIEAETAKLVGTAHVTTEPEYNSNYEKMEDITFVGEFDKAVAAGDESAFILYVNSYSAGVADLTFRMGNGNLRKEGTTYTMLDLQINSVMDFSINGQPITVADDVILPGCGPNTDYAPLYNIYHDVAIPNVTFKAGVNEIRIDFKTSTLGEETNWGRTPSSVNIDWVKINCDGTKIADGATIMGIEVDDTFTNAKYGDLISTVPAVAIMSDGNKVMLDNSAYTVVGTNDEQKKYITFGENAVTVTLNENPLITASGIINLDVYYETLATGADIIVEGDNVYYTFTFANRGYSPDDYLFFGESATEVYPVEKYDEGIFETTFYINATNLAAGTRVMPHLSINGVNYVNGANANGDIRGDALVFEDRKNVIVNNKLYVLYSCYSMPVLEVFDASGNVCVALQTDVVIESGKVYWTLTAVTKGYAKDKFEFFDGTTFPIAKTVENDNVITFYVDTTDLALKQHYPHLRIDGTNYNNGKNDKGDFLMYAGGYTNNKVVTFEGKKYTIKTSYGMGTLTIANA